MTADCTKVIFYRMNRNRGRQLTCQMVVAEKWRAMEGVGIRTRMEGREGGMIDSALKCNILKLYEVAYGSKNTL